MPEPLAFLNGEYLPAAQARLPVYDLGVVQGATVVEHTRTFGGRPFRLDDHLDRLAHSLSLARIELSWSRDEIVAIGERLLANNIPLATGDLGLIHLATPGAAAPYNAMTGELSRTGPTFCVHTYPLPLVSWREKYASGVRLATPATRQIPPECLSPHLKTRSRMHYYLAEREARDVDDGAWALLLDGAGRLTETAAANVLLVVGDEIRSPRFDRTLAGITRQVVIELAERQGMQFVKGDWTIADALAADEVLLTSTGFCLLAAISLNGQPIGAGRPGPVFHRLLAAFETLVGERFSQV